VLIALLLPAVQTARESARRTQCSNNLKQIGLGLHNYESTHKRLPGGSGYTVQPGTWVIAALPFMEQGNLIGQLDLRKFPDEAPNVTILQTYVNPGFICPTDPKAQEPVLKNRRQGAGSHNPPTCQGLWYTGSMGPTIPDRCDFVLDQLRSREVCM